MRGQARIELIETGQHVGPRHAVGMAKDLAGEVRTAGGFEQPAGEDRRASRKARETSAAISAGTGASWATRPTTSRCVSGGSDEVSSAARSAVRCDEHQRDRLRVFVGQEAVQLFLVEVCQKIEQALTRIVGGVEAVTGLGGVGASRGKFVDHRALFARWNGAGAGDFRQHGLGLGRIELCQQIGSLAGRQARQ